jgi:uncharacterized protein (TIGR02145 family)
MKKLILVAALTGCMTVQGFAQIDKAVLINETFTIPSHTPAPDGATYRWIANSMIIDGATEASYTGSLPTAGIYMFIRQAKLSGVCDAWMSSNPYVLIVMDCPYTGSDLYYDATHLCQQRTSGAGNWEAWIQDTRDSELYRIVYMPDTKWWTAEEMRYHEPGSPKSYKCPNEEKRTIYNRPNIACPSDWSLPSIAEFTNLRTFASLAELLAIGTHPYYGTGSDKFGFSIVPSMNRMNNLGDAGYPTGNCLEDLRNLWVTSWESKDGMRFLYTSTSSGSFTETWNQARCIR